MHFSKRALLVFLALGPALAGARPWQGITPGTSTQQQVSERFGEPTSRTKRTGRTILAYHGDQALAGTRQAQFHVSDAGVVQEITIFLTAQLDPESIEGTYGKPPQKTFVEDTFQKVWLYPAQGVTVYFGRDGFVEALSFGPGRKTGSAQQAPAPGPPPRPADGSPPPAAPTPTGPPTPAGPATPPGPGTAPGGR
jgi:hypothetical protein